MGLNKVTLWLHICLSLLWNPSTCLLLESLKRVFFKGVAISNSVTISHLFYADDAVFVGDWSESNLASILNVLHCFSLTSGLKINVHKSQLLGVGVPPDIIEAAGHSLGCSVMKTPFKYLGVPVGGNMHSIKAWDDVIRKIKSRLSKWKVNTLSVGGRLSLLKSVLGSSPSYWLSLFKVPKGVLASMEALRKDFCHGAHNDVKKIAWVKFYRLRKMVALEYLVSTLQTGPFFSSGFGDSSLKTIPFGRGLLMRFMDIRSRFLVLLLLRFGFLLSENFMFSKIVVLIW